MKHIVFENKTLSKLSLGTVQFGLNYGIANTKGQPTQKEVNSIIRYVCSEGINCFDTAQAYGESEKVLGIALKNSKSSIIISKLKSDLFVNNLTSNISNSLQHLNQKSLFGLMLHDSKLLYEWKEEYSLKVDLLIYENKIDYFGVSIYSEDDFLLAIHNDKVKIIQIPFKLFDQRAIRMKLLDPRVRGIFITPSLIAPHEV